MQLCLLQRLLIRQVVLEKARGTVDSQPREAKASMWLECKCGRGAATGEPMARGVPVLPRAAVLNSHANHTFNASL